MNCQNFEAIVNDLARTQLLEISVQEQALAHSGDCEACAQRLEDERALSRSLQALAAEMRSVEVSDRVEEELLIAFRNLGVARPRSNATNHWRYWAAAAAAVLLLVFGIIAMRSRMDQPKLHEQAKDDAKALTPSSSGIHSSDLAALSAPKPGAVSRPNPIRTKVGTKAKPRAGGLKDRPKGRGETKDANGDLDEQSTGNETASNYAEKEVATGFLPVGYANPMTLQDGGQLVRVELPRSALASFGLPVNLNRANERVKADVLVGSDGQARAIRFVQ